MNFETFKHNIEIGRAKLLQINRVGKFGQISKEAKKKNEKTRIC